MLWPYPELYQSFFISRRAMLSSSIDPSTPCPRPPPPVVHAEEFTLYTGAYGFLKILGLHMEKALLVVEETLGAGFPHTSALPEN
jgi:hypothetical protein